MVLSRGNKWTELSQDSIEPKRVQISMFNSSTIKYCRRSNSRNTSRHVLLFPLLPAQMSRHKSSLFLSHVRLSQHQTRPKIGVLGKKKGPQVFQVNICNIMSRIMCTIKWIPFLSSNTGHQHQLFLPVMDQHSVVSPHLPCFSGHTVTGCFSNSSVYSTTRPKVQHGITGPCCFGSTQCCAFTHKLMN